MLKNKKIIWIYYNYIIFLVNLIKLIYKYKVDFFLMYLFVNMLKKIEFISNFI